MKFNKLVPFVEKYSKSFWVVNTVGWIIYWLGMLIISLQYLEFKDFTSYYAYSYMFFWGWLSTIPLRYVYRKIDYKSSGIALLGFKVLVLAYFVAHLWYWSDLVFSLTVFSYDSLKDYFSIQYAITRTLTKLFVILIWSSLYFIGKIWDDWTIQKNRAREAEVLLQQAELKLLRYQLNPHFLFNSLNSIRALTNTNPSLVRDMVTELSEFLKYTLLNKNRHEVSLEEELDSIKHYCRIEERRFENNLEIEYEIDPLAEEYPVPMMILHPLVENAIKYGMATSMMPLKINITAAIEGDLLRLSVSNTGKWINESDKKNITINGTNTGIINLRKRLENYYPNENTFNIIKEENMVVVIITLKRSPQVKDE